MKEKDTRPYITVTNDFFDHPKTLAVSEAAQLHILRLWGYSNKHRTDGKLPAALVKQKGAKVAKELVSAGWVEVDEDGQHWAHDYLDHQPSKAEIETRIEAKKVGGATGGRLGMHRRWHVKAGIVKDDCDLCQASVA